MNKYDKFVGLFGKFYDENDIKIDEKLSSYVNFKVGGPADILLIPKSKEQVIKSVEVCKENKIPFYLIGNGSNILVRDGGFRGVVISLKEVKTIIVDGDKIEAECGAMLKAVSDKGPIWRRRCRRFQQNFSAECRICGTDCCDKAFGIQCCSV